MKILMLTGVTGAGKSTLFRCLKKKAEDLGFSSEIFLSAYHCQNSFKETNFNFQKLLEFYRGIFQFEDIECSRGIGVLFENSFYNVCLEYNLSAVEIAKFKKLFGKHQCKNVVLMLPEDKIYDRSIVSTRIYRKPSWSNYLDEFNLSEEELTTMFQEKQRKLFGLAQNSLCNTCWLDTSDMKWDEYAQEICEFWKE